MDVPSWHPANQDSELTRRLLAMGGGQSASARTEFKVMAGSTADTSTEAGRQLMSELGDGGGAAYEGRGFFDTSDRLYLMEQKRLQQELKEKEKADQEAELQKFRSTALKVQAQKATLTLPEVLPEVKTKKQPSVDTTPSLVVIKPKKRNAAQMEGKKKKAKKHTASSEDLEKNSNSETITTSTNSAKDEPNSSSSNGAEETKISTNGTLAATTAVKHKPSVSLLSGYSSSSDSDS